MAGYTEVHRFEVHGHKFIVYESLHYNKPRWDFVHEGRSIHGVGIKDHPSALEAVHVFTKKAEALLPIEFKNLCDAAWEKQEDWK